LFGFLEEVDVFEEDGFPGDVVGGCGTGGGGGLEDDAVGVFDMPLTTPTTNQHFLTSPLQMLPHLLLRLKVHLTTRHRTVESNSGAVLSMVRSLGVREDF